MRAYAKRLLNPFQGVMQIVCTDHARALSVDGQQWELQYRSQLPESTPAMLPNPTAHHYARVGRWSKHNGLHIYPLHPALKPALVETHCQPLLAYLPSVVLPLPLEDHFEYWLLDENSHLPLALLASECQLEALPHATKRPVWEPLNASQLVIPLTVEEQQLNATPVNYRLGIAVKQRAGQNPQAAWFKRETDGNGQCLASDLQSTIAKLPHHAFPELLLTQQWSKPTLQSLYERYLNQLVPRLLLLKLTLQTRTQLEKLLQPHLHELAQWYRLYPAIADPAYMTALCVQARLRKTHDL